MNAPAPTFDAEQARLAAAAHLQPAHFVEFQRLAKSLIHGPQFQLLIVDCRDERLRAKVLLALAQVQQQAGLRGVELALNDDLSNVQALEARLVDLAAEHQVIHLLDASIWMDATRWESFNLLRERLSASVRARLVIWLNEVSIAQVARYSPDIWAWRSGVYPFPQKIIFGNSPGIFSSGLGIIQNGLISSIAFFGGDEINFQKHVGRSVEISDWLNRPHVPNEIRVPLVEELNDLLSGLHDIVSHGQGGAIPNEFYPVIKECLIRALKGVEMLKWMVMRDHIFPNECSENIVLELRLLDQLFRGHGGS